MAAPDRFTVLASLPPHGGFRRVLALDGAGAARAVVLAFVPAAVTDDPPRLAAVLRDAEAAARLHHPGAASVLGTETVGGELAVVELHRAGASLRALLDAGGRLPPDVATRIVLDACAAASRAHAVDAGDGMRLAHGAIDAARLVVGEDGVAFVCGFALAGGGDPAADVRALGAVLYECLAGEPPGAPPRRLDAPGVPIPLTTAVNRATGAAGEPFDSAAALAGAVAEAIPPAPHAAVAAYADAILPEDEGERAELRRTLATALGGTVAERVPRGLAADAAGTFPRPVPPPRPSRLPIAVAALCLAAGFAIGFSLARGRSTATWTSTSTATATGTATETTPPTPTATTPPTPTATATTTPPPTPTPTASPDPPPSPARAERRMRSAPPRTGKLDVTAPEDAEVFLDGRRIGRGSVQIEIAEGRHRIEVRRDGATASERFTLRPGETWTYTVTPTPP